MSTAAEGAILKRFTAGLAGVSGEASPPERRLGSELKFPLVSGDGQAAPPAALEALWSFLGQRGWTAETDTLTGAVSGARKPGERNDTIASFETGYCKPEFSLAHVGTLQDLTAAVCGLCGDLREFAGASGALLLGYGIQPVTPPSRNLLRRKVRSSLWDKAVPSNRVIPPAEGDDVHLFTINAASHVHVQVGPDEAVPLTNVLNGFAGAQIALMANSSVWQGAVSPDYKCVAEKLWDWWAPAAGRSGMPEAPFADIRHYAAVVGRLRPIYIKRDGKPLLINHYASFVEYYDADAPMARDLDGNDVAVTPVSADLDLHNSCYWYNARISKYYTVENRVCDQQPGSDLITPAALTLGLVSALAEAREEIEARNWADLRRAREAACRSGLQGTAGSLALCDWARRMLDIARLGLTRRGLGEETHLDPLFERLRCRRCPADDAADIATAHGAAALAAARRL